MDPEEVPRWPPSSPVVTAKTLSSETVVISQKCCAASKIEQLELSSTKEIVEEIGISKVSPEDDKLIMKQIRREEAEIVHNVKVEAVDDSTLVSKTIFGDIYTEDLTPSAYQVNSEYTVLSETIVTELLTHLRISQEGEIEIKHRGHTVSRIATIVETAVKPKYIDFRFGEMIDPSTVKIKMKAQSAQSLRMAATLNAKSALFLNLSMPERYSGILPGDLVQRLMTNSSRSQCVLNKVRNKDGKSSRCALSSTNNQTARHFVEELACLPTPRKLSDVKNLLGLVIENATCTRAHRVRAKNKLELICHLFYEAVERDEQEQRKTEFEELERWILAIVQPYNHPNQTKEREALPDDSDADRQVVNKIPFLNTLSLLFDGKSGLESIRGQIATLPIGKGSIAKYFVPFTQRKARMHLSPTELVADIAKSDLPRKIRNYAGRIYVYWHEGNFEWRKIGCTTQDTRERTNQWSDQCGLHASEQTTRSKFGDTVKHLSRVEELIHAELAEHRYYEIECAGCGKSHDEWFQVSIEHANAVVKKWTGWMQEWDPYDEQGRFRTDIEIKLPEIGYKSPKEALTPPRYKRASLGYKPRRSSGIKNKSLQS